MQRSGWPVGIIAIITITALSLTGCGVKGELETPPPLWGDGAPSEKDNNPSGSDQDDN